MSVAVCKISASGGCSFCGAGLRRRANDRAAAASMKTPMLMLECHRCRLRLVALASEP